ncbi:MAG: hpt [Parachlamydiales bacterium]|nr:hpt [Parachlamydiales bacterium]
MGVPLINLKPLILQKQIATKIAEIARAIDREYQGKDLVILMVLKGAICLAADLIRAIQIACDIEVVQCKSYGSGGTRRKALQILGLEPLELQGRDVLIVDDIFDSGHTLDGLMQAIALKKPRSVKSLVLLYKNVQRTVALRPDYVLFEIENHFVVGYGLDYKELYRGLPGVYIYEETE